MRELTSWVGFPEWLLLIPFFLRWERLDGRCVTTSSCQRHQVIAGSHFVFYSVAATHSFQFLLFSDGATCEVSS